MYGFFVLKTKLRSFTAANTIQYFIVMRPSKVTYIAVVIEALKTGRSNFRTVVLFYLGPNLYLSARADR